MRPALALGLLLSALFLHAAQARPFTVEDLLNTEGLGQVMFDPTGRWLVVEHRRPWRAAAVFDLNVQTPARLTRLEGVDTRAPRQARPLFPQDPRAGYLAGPFAPDGRRLLVYRLEDHKLTAGVLDLHRRQVAWLQLTPEQPVYGRAAQWRSAGQLVLIARPDGDLPRQYALGWRASQRLAQQAARTAAGQTPSRTRWGSGRFLALKPERPPSRLLTVDVATGRSRTLARGDFVDLELSPDGRWAALLEDREPIPPQAQARVYVALPSRRRTLTLVDLQTGGLTRPCDPGDVARNPLSWSLDSRSLLVALRAPNPAGAAWDARALARIDPRRGDCAPVALGDLLPVLGHSSEGNPLLQTGWRGRDPLLLARPGPTARADVYQLAPGGPINLTAALPAPPTGFAQSAPGQLQVTTASGLWQVAAPPALPQKLAGVSIGNPEPGGSRILARAAPDGPASWADGALNWPKTGLPPIRLPPDAEPLAATGAAAAALTRASNGPMRLDLVSARGRRTPVLSLNAADRDIIPARIVAVPHPGPHGEALTHWLYLPPTVPSGARMPLVVIPYRSAVYPRPPAEQAPGAWNDWANAQILAGAGYAVLVPSLPYDAATGEPAARQAWDILRAVDAALSAHPELDPDRLGLLGQSFGAFSAVAAAEQSPRFKTVVASAGIYDQISLWGIFPWHQALIPEDGYAPNLTNGLVEQGQARMGAPPWADPGRYLRNSPLFAADQITAPVLILHGQSDEIGAFQAQELFSALYRQGKDAQLVIYGAEGHTTASPANIANKWAIILDWLAQTLGPPAPPSPPTPEARPRR